jgi:hypothetical protein
LHLLSGTPSEACATAPSCLTFSCYLRIVRIPVKQPIYQRNIALNKTRIQDKYQCPTCFGTEMSSSGSLLEQRGIQVQHTNPGIPRWVYWTCIHLFNRGWHSGAETCRSLILVMNCILLSVFVGRCIGCSFFQCHHMSIETSWFPLVVAEV